MSRTVDDFAEQTCRMMTVLYKLGHLDSDNVIQTKGRAAAEIEACDELLAAELLLAGTFNDLSPSAAVSLCSALIAPDGEKVKRALPPPAELVGAFQELQKVARTVANVLNDAHIQTDEDEV